MILAVVFSCSKKKDSKKIVIPPGIITAEQMENVLADVYLVEGSLQLCAKKTKCKL